KDTCTPAYDAGTRARSTARLTAHSLPRHDARPVHKERKPMPTTPRRLRPLLLALALLATPGGATTALAQVPPVPVPVTGPAATLLPIAARAEARRVPAVATLSAGVATQAGDAQAALRHNAVRTEGVMAALRKAGAAERDIRTAGVNLSPQYRH